MHIDQVVLCMCQAAAIFMFMQLAGWYFLSLWCFYPCTPRSFRHDWYSCRSAVLMHGGFCGQYIEWADFRTLYCQEEIIYLLCLKAFPFSTYLWFFKMSPLEFHFHAILSWAWHERTLSHFYVTVFAKSAQLRTHWSPLWSEWIIAPDCVY